MKKVTLLFILSFLFGLFSCWKLVFAGRTSQLVISEVLIGTNLADEEFVEIYNAGGEDIDLRALPLKLHTVNSTGSDTDKTLSFINPVVKAGNYYLIASKAYYEKYKQELPIGATYSASLVSNGAVYISTSPIKDVSIIDLVCWGSSQKCSDSLSNPKKNYSLEKTRDWTGWQESYVEGGTPGVANSEKFTDENENENEEDLFGDSELENEAECVVYSKKVLLNEIFPYSESEGEFVEIFNFGEECVDVSGWKVMDKAGHKKIFPRNSILHPQKYLYLEGNLYLNNGSDTVYLLDARETEKEKALDRISYVGGAKNYSWSFDGENWSWTSKATPGEENKFDEKEHGNNFEAGEYNIRLNEILPNPKGDEKNGEYVEIFNGEDFQINLENWMLKDDSKTKFIFSEGYLINSGGYLILYRDEFKFAMNNSGRESVYLLDPDGNIISFVTYDGTKENASYNFDGQNWRWSRRLTPGKENEFNAPPRIKIKEIKTAYAGVPVSFSVQARDRDKDKLKFIWNFGDGKRSYLQETFHIYKKRGRYLITLSVDDGSEKVVKEFKLKVEKYPSVSLEIIRLLPNPPGLDSGNEWIEIKNNEKKKINLKGCKIATGSEKLINHVVADDFEINPGQSRQLTRKDAFFYLNNKAMKIELRYPDGRTADRVSYAKEKIADGEVYQKTARGWQWITPHSSEEELIYAEEMPNEEVLNEEENFKEELLNEEHLEFLGGQSLRTQKQEKENPLSYGTKIKFSIQENGQQEKVLGTEVVLNKDGIYYFTHPTPEDHYAVKFSKSIAIKLNSLINSKILKMNP